MLGVHERRVTQALDPAMVKVAKLWRVDPTRTMKALIEATEDLEPMTDDELAIREAMLTGRLDRDVVHPHR